MIMPRFSVPSDDAIAREERALRELVGDVHPVEPSPGYFDAFAARVAARLERERRAEHAAPRRPKRRIALLRPAMGFALTVAAAVFMSRARVETLDQDAAALSPQDVQVLQDVEAPLTSTAVTEVQTGEDLAAQARAQNVDLDEALVFDNGDNVTDDDIVAAGTLPEYDETATIVTDDDAAAIVASLQQQQY